MKAYLIDPEFHSVKEVDYSGDYKQIYSLIGCETFGCVEIHENGDTLFIDDNGKLGDLSEKYFFVVDVPGGQHLIAGKALVLGTDEEGESVEPKLNSIAVECRVHFIPDFLQDRARAAAYAEIEAGPIVMFGEEAERAMFGESAK